jgi:hypothetical protein
MRSYLVISSRHDALPLMVAQGGKKTTMVVGGESLPTVDVPSTGGI